MENEFTELDVCLAKTTNPLTEIDDELIDQLCSITVATTNGPCITLRFLAYKAQSPQIREALHSLQVLEKVVKRGGYKIAEEIGKFRFLNEIIKIVSPKYLAYRTSPCVRQRIVELIFLWSMEFKELPKIFEAYQMLKVQKIITEDPVHVLENFRPPTPPQPRPKDEIFDDEKTVQTLKSLLESGRPEQLESANQLIKNLALKAESRIQFRCNFNSELDSIQNCAQLLCDMLAQCNLNLRVDATEKVILNKGASEEDIQLMRELFASCEKARLKLFKFANQIQDKDSEELNRLITVAELLTSTINSCKRYFALLNNPKLISLFRSVNSIFSEDSNELRSELTSCSEERLLDLNCSPPTSPLFNLEAILNSTECQDHHSLNDLPSPLDSIKDRAAFHFDEQEYSPKPAKFKSAVDELNALSEQLIKQHLTGGEVKQQQLCLNQLRMDSGQPSSSGEHGSSSRSSSVSDKPLTDPDVSDTLANLFIPYDSIKPCEGVKAPLVVFDQNGLMITLHFTSNRPHKQILVFLLTFTNYNPISVSNIQFLAAVPKNMKVKLQSQTATSLPPLESTQKIPEHFFTQVMLLAFKQSATEEESTDSLDGIKFRLKYKFSYLMNEIPFEHVSYFDWTFSNSQLIDEN